MTGPIFKPFPLSHPADLQGREEVERLKALEDVEFAREDEIRARAESAEFLPIAAVDEERVETDWDRMLRDPDPNEVFHDRYRGVL